MSRSPRVLILTLSFGSGHIQAARAVGAEITRNAPDADVRIIDALAESRSLFRFAYVRPYWAMIRYAPWLWRKYFSSRLAHLTRQTAPTWAFRFGCPAVFKAIVSFRPDVIVAAEVAACEMSVIAKARRLTNASIVSVVTDHHAEPAWVKVEVDAYLVPDEGVAEQLREWGAPAEKIVVSGIPVENPLNPPKPLNPPNPVNPLNLLNDVENDAHGRTRVHAPAIPAITADRPVVLLMGGGMGPSRIDRVARALCAGNTPMQLVAIAGHDRRARRRLRKLRGTALVSLNVVGWIDDVPALMQMASVLVTKPGGVTTAEAALCGLPLVMFDPVPGPEESNAARIALAGAGTMTEGPAAAAREVIMLLRDEPRRRAMSAAARALARPHAASEAACLTLFQARRRAGAEQRTTSDRPVLILTISNGAGHSRAAEAIAAAVRSMDPSLTVRVIDVADYMTTLLRLTHVTIYLWLVKHAPGLWDGIDRFQKRRPHTSPEWYYRWGCARLFSLLGEMNPRAVIATEVGCCEIASLVKRDLALDAPLVAVNGEYDADRAWVQPEVDLYCAPTEPVVEEFCANGAPRERVRAWGVPLAAEFVRGRESEARAVECRRLGLTPTLPLVLVAGGSEGVGRVEAAAARLLRLEPHRPQVVVLAGRNERLKLRCERLARREGGERLRVLGWTMRMPELMRAADLMVSKLGHTFDEAIASTLPIVALEPPPGSEQVQRRLLEQWGVGRAVGDEDEMADTIARLLADRGQLDAMRRAAGARPVPDAANKIAAWVVASSSERIIWSSNRVRPGGPAPATAPQRASS